MSMVTDFEKRGDDGVDVWFSFHWGKTGGWMQFEIKIGGKEVFKNGCFLLTVTFGHTKLTCAPSHPELGS